MTVICNQLIKKFHFEFLHVFNFFCAWNKEVNSCSGFDLTTHDLYFTILIEALTNHILAKITYFTNHTDYGTIEHKIMVLKPTNKNQNIRQCHNFRSILIEDFQHHPFLYQVKESFIALFTELKMANC